MKYFFFISLLIIAISLLEIKAQQAVDLNGKDVVPIINFPGVNQNDWQDAFSVLQSCTVTNLPVHGFTHPFTYPGGLYDKWWYRIDSINVLGVKLPTEPTFEKFWWELDGSLALSGAKWVNEDFAENVMRDFINVQKPSGRIPLFSLDKLSQSRVSAFPVLFEIGYDIAERSNDETLVRQIFSCLRKYLDWWLSQSVRRDSTTGLITGIFEESLPPDEGDFFTRAPVDLNCEVIIGCDNVARLAKFTGDIADYLKYKKIGQSLRNSVNKYLWADSAYYPYNVKKRILSNRLTSNAFYPLEDSIATEDRIKKLVNILTNNRYFNWNDNPVTTAAKSDSEYNETPGVYNGKQWLGDIWTMKNVAIIQGLEDIGRYDLASYLSYKTVMLFNNNYSEFIIPSTGLGQGQLQYCWSASQYIQILIEHIFGIEYDEFNKTITIMPRLDRSLLGKSLSLDSLLLPDNNRLYTHIRFDDNGNVSINYQITGNEKNEMKVVIALPANGKTQFKAIGRKNRNLALNEINKGLGNIFEYSNGLKSKGNIYFILQK
jgi:Mannosylglycerate hydrolase MGH1-like glycoside hydrolase domain